MCSTLHAWFVFTKFVLLGAVAMCDESTYQAVVVVNTVNRMRLLPFFAVSYARQGCGTGQTMLLSTVVCCCLFVLYRNFKVLWKSWFAFTHKWHHQAWICSASLPVNHDSLLLFSRYSRYRFRTRVLTAGANSQTSLRTTVLGHSLEMPICIAPTALHGIAHLSKEHGAIKGKK